MRGQLENRSYTLWQFVKIYWQSEHRLFAYSMLFFVILMTIALVGLDVVFSYWYNYFYNALQDYNKREVIDLLVIFCWIAAINIVIGVYRYYLQAFLGMRWRRWLTDQFLDRWLQKRSYYYLENFDERTDNPDQRIQEDVGAFVVSSLSLLIGAISAFTTFFAFIYILWRLSGVIHIPLGFGTLGIPGYLAWVGIIYAIVGTVLAFKVGYPLVPLNFEQQRKEANFRFAAIDLRMHSEHVALYRGEAHQKTVLDRLVNIFIDNWYMIILRQKMLLWFTLGYNQVAVILPLVVALPSYFQKVFKLGSLVQTLNAFTQVHNALSFFINSYVQIAELRAVMRRLLGFLNHMYEIDRKAEAVDHFKFNSISQPKIVLKNVDILTPRGDLLLKNVNEAFIHGKHYLIKGESGIGKSTLVRAIAQIWPFGSGEIDLPEQQKIMYLPQRSYMPIGTLREALLFPDRVHAIPKEKLIELLEECGLAQFVDRLNDFGMWSQQLSPGEQQRVAFVRVLIHKPDWVFLDECTSALDLRSEKRLYELLKMKLPNCSLISVGHRPSLSRHHDFELDVEKYSVERVV